MLDVQTVDGEGKSITDERRPFCETLLWIWLMQPQKMSSFHNHWHMDMRLGLSKDGLLIIIGFIVQIYMYSTRHM